MISKKALLELLENWRDRLGITPPEEAAKIIIKAVIDKVKAFPEEVVTDINVGNKWIPVSEQLPDNEDDVLIFYKEKYEDDPDSYAGIAISRYAQVKLGSLFDLGYKDWMAPFEYFHKHYKVVAWQPLPEPYMQKKVE